MTSNINNAIVSTESIHDDLFGQTKDKYIAHQSNKKTKNWDFKKLEFRKVSFYYKPDEIVLNNLNLEIQSSSSTLITGPSGCGKSTTIDLLLGFFKPSSGKILVNESESEIAELRDNTYYTSQNKFLFNQTIFNNIVLDENKSNYKDLNNDEKINFNKSLELSRLDKIIDNKTEGLDFYIGESGNNLSGVLKTLSER